jgi:tetratricopeptide (TPR) repeat protein
MRMLCVRSLLLTVAAATAGAWMATAQTPPLDTLVAKANALMQRNSYADAARVFEQLTLRHPEQSLYWVRLGIARQMAGNRDEALAAYRRGVELGAGATAQYNIATVFALKGVPDSAFRWLTASVGSGFASVQTLTADRDLAGLHDDPRWATLVDTVKRAGMPCMYRPESRAFDFWVGEWDVVNAAGNPAGTSSVQLLLNGCALFENWSTGGNGDGKSLNSYNADLKMWQQFWTDQTGRVTEYRTSEWISGSLRYTARQSLPRPRVLHMTFTPINKDLVRQWGEVSTDDGKTWTMQYDLYYHRKS